MRDAIPITAATAPTLADVARELGDIRAALAVLVAERGQEPAYIDARAVAARLGISKASVHRMVASGFLPSPIRLGKSSRWAWSEIEKSIARKRK